MRNDEWSERFALPPRVLNSLPEAQRTRSLHATEFLASQMERVREVTSWSGLVWGEHRSVATCPDHPRYSRTPRTSHQRYAKSRFLSTLPACRLGECPDRSGPDTPLCSFLVQSHESPPHPLRRPEAQR